MNQVKNLTGPCTHCGAGIEFPATSIGQVAPCPHCGRPTELILAPPAPAESPVSLKLMIWTVVGILVLVLGLVATVAGLKHYQKELRTRQQTPASH